MTLEWKSITANTPNLFATEGKFAFYLTFIPVNATLTEVMGKEWAMKKSGWVVSVVRTFNDQSEVRYSSSNTKLLGGVEAAKQLAIKYREQLTKIEV